VSLPSGLQSLGSEAFSLSGLTNVSIPQSVQRIGADCFFGAPLQDATLPAQLLASAGSIGLPAQIATDLLTEGLKGQGFITSNSLGLIVSSTIAQVQANPNTYNLFSASQHAAAYANGLAAGASSAGGKAKGKAKGKGKKR